MALGNPLYVAPAADGFGVPEYRRHVSNSNAFYQKTLCKRVAKLVRVTTDASSFENLRVYLPPIRRQMMQVALTCPERCLAFERVVILGREGH